VATGSAWCCSAKPRSERLSGAGNLFVKSSAWGLILKVLRWLSPDRSCKFSAKKSYAIASVFFVASAGCLGPRLSAPRGLQRPSYNGRDVCQRRVPAPDEPPPLPPVALAGPAAAAVPQQLRTTKGHSLLAINPQAPGYKVSVPAQCTSQAHPLVSRVRICVSVEGTVSSVQILKASLPILDSQLPTVLRRWRFHSYVKDGQATPFCYVLHYALG